MNTIAIPAQLARDLLEAVDSLGEPDFFVVSGDGTNGLNPNEAVIMDAELRGVGEYELRDIETAKRVAKILNLISVELRRAIPGDPQT